MKKLLIIFLLATAFTASAVSPAAQADSAYIREQYGQAIELYNKLLRDYGPDAEVYYNLGNAYFRNDNPGRAVLAYERSLRIDPSNADARHNLAFVRARLDDRPEDDSSFLSNLNMSIMGIMSANAWAITALVIFVLVLGCVALYIFPNIVWMRKVGFFGGIVLIFVFIYALTLAFLSVARARSHDEAVVIAPSTYLSSAPRAPRNADEHAVALHAGTVVEIIDSVPTPDDAVSPMWYNVKLNNSTRAWLRSSDVERI